MNGSANPPTGVFDDATLFAVLRATELAAAAAWELVGGGDRNGLDAAAVAALRAELASAPIDGVVVVGEGEKDEAPMLYAGERVGTGYGPSVDIALDPVDGTTLAAEGLPGAIAVLALAPAGSLFDPGPVFYMDKLVTSAAARHAGLSLADPVALNLRRLADALGRDLRTLRVGVQERPRNALVASAVERAGAHLVAFRHGDVTRAVSAASSTDSDLDIVLGIGGAPEGVLTAVAVEALGGFMEGRLSPQTPAELHGAEAASIDLSRILSLGDLASAPGAFVLSAITGHGDLAAVRVDGSRAIVQSIVVSNGATRSFSRDVARAAVPGRD